MTASYRLKHIVFTLLLCLLASSLLTACNEQNPYGDENVGEADKPFDTDPSNGLTRIALYANKPIQGLYYVCNGRAKSRSYTQPVRSSSQSTATNANKDSNPVAQCGNDATQVTFYLGIKNQLATNRFKKLGSILLPNMTVAGTDGKARHDVVTDKLSRGAVYLSYSIADLQSAPRRTGVTNAFDSQGNCKANREDACAVVYKTALLMALDDTSTSTGVLNIPVATNRLMANSNTYAQQGFDQPSYAQFKNAWQPFVAAAGGHLPTSLAAANPNAGNPNLSISGNILNGAGRLNAGTYKLQVSNAINSPGQADQSRLVGRVWAYPDGGLVGLGVYNKDPNDVCSAEVGALQQGSVQTSQEWSDFMVCIIKNNTTGELFTLTGNNSQAPHLSDQSALSNVQLNFLDNSLTPQPQPLLTGTLFGQFLYNGINAPDTTRNDFALDYGSNLKTGEEGVLKGLLPNINTVKSYPVRMTQRASIQLTPLNNVALAALQNGAVYKLQLMRYCTAAEKSDAACQPIPSQPAGEIGKGGNYAADIPGANAGSAKERPRLNAYGDTSKGDAIYLEFHQQNNGSWVLHLLKPDCSGPVTDTSNAPLKVGYVFATPSDTSADISITLLPHDKSNIAAMPQLGGHLEGRIDFDKPSWPLYRTGDTSFNDGLRAHWADPVAYYSFEYLQTVTNYEDQAVLDMLSSLNGGAVIGEKVTSCTPQ